MSLFFSTLQRLATFLICVFCLIIFLIGTTPGLHTTLWLLKPYLPATLIINGIEGQLWDKVHIHSINYQATPETFLTFRDVEITWQPLQWINSKQSDNHVSWKQLDIRANNDPIPIQSQGHCVITGVWPELNITANVNLQRDHIQSKLTLEGQLNESGLKAQGRWVLNEQLASHISLLLPHFKLWGPYTTQPIKSHIQFDQFKLSQLSTEQSKLDGNVELNLFINGLLGEPDLSGKLTLHQGFFEYPEWGIRLSSFDTTLTSQGNQWQMLGHLYPLNQTKAIIIKGKGKKTSGQWDIQGDSIEFINSPALGLFISPHLNLKLNDGKWDLSGDLLIPKAIIKPTTFSNSVQLTDDAVFIDHTSDKKTLLPLNVNVNLTMGEDVALKLQGIQGYLNGQLALIQTPQSQLVAKGELTLRNGQYQSHGQSFQLKDSNLIFSGETLDNPRMHVLATRSINQNKKTAAEASKLFNFQASNLPHINYSGQLTVGIEMSGRLKNPKVKLFSSPATLSDADILSFLLLGKPASEANQSGVTLLMSAVNAYNLDSTVQGAHILKNLQNLKSRLALDVDIQPNNSTSIQTPTSATVGIGKSITERVYIHYSVNPFQDNSNVITLTYLLNQFFSIQVSASDIGNGIDLLYT